MSNVIWRNSTNLITLPPLVLSVCVSAMQIEQILCIAPDLRYLLIGCGSAEQFQTSLIVLLSIFAIFAKIS